MMQLRQVLKSKIHMARVTGTVLDYEGSIGIDAAIIDAADMMPGERVQVLNFNNGERIETYIIEEEKGSGSVTLYGPAARRAQAGDKISILSYIFSDEEGFKSFETRKITLDSQNRIKGR